MLSQLRNFEYRIEPDGGHARTVILELDRAQQELVIDKNYIAPAWAKLTFNQCPHCPFDERVVNYCPVARNIAFVFNDLVNYMSYEKVKLTVSCDIRSYVMNTTMQRVMGSLFGLVSAFSPCPYTKPLRPMGLFHLPIMTDTEVIVRSFSFFLLKEYLGQKQGHTEPLDLTYMKQVYADLKILNQYLIGRFREIQEYDASINAVVLLDLSARDISHEIDSCLESIQDLFQ